MKIVVIGNYYYPEHVGGVEVVAYNLVKYYRQFDHQVRWIAADVLPNRRKEASGDVPIRSCNFAEEKLGFPFPIPYPNTIIQLYNTIKWCDVIHLHDCLYPINMLSFVMLKILQRPVLITQHIKPFPYKSILKRLIQNIALRTIAFTMHLFADKSVFISTNTRDHLPFISHRLDADVISNGVDTNLFAPLSLEKRSRLRRKINGDVEKPIILFVGRFVEIKGVHLLFPLIKKYSNWHWLLVGRADDYDPSNWDYSNVTWYSKLTMEEMRDAYALADVLVHPSVGEGITLTIRESMACGLPVIISDELLYDISKRERSCFISIKPETKEIEKALIKFFADTQLRKELSKEVRSFIISQSSWDVVARKYLVHIERLHNTKVGVIE